MNIKSFFKNYAAISFAAMIVAVAFAATVPAEAQVYSRIGTQLSSGSSGLNVRNLQSFLASDSDIYPQGLVTGTYGPLTKAAVVNFQAAYGIPTVGNVGPMTLAKMNSLIDAGQGLDLRAPLFYSVSSSTFSNNVVLSWTTSEPARAKVFYSTVPLTAEESSSAQAEPYISGTVLSDTAYTTSKQMTLPSLSANTTYYFMIEAIDQAGNVSIYWKNTVKTP